MNSLKMTIASAFMVLVLIMIFLHQMIHYRGPTKTFTCRGNLSMMHKERNFTGSFQFIANQGKGAIILLGIYTDEQGVRHSASIHNELNSVSRHGDLYTMRFAKAVVIPDNLAKDSAIMNMFHPYLLDGKNGEIFYHIFIQPSGNKVVSLGKVPELTCRTPD
ncbi:hypothetical protein GWD52_14145 [Enterobacteriaceae bacterium 4M9]|nr:hypothetical protein [Enterobacteriaceae bacterium 4M9]